MNYFKSRNKKKSNSIIKDTISQNKDSEMKNALQNSINKLPFKHRVVFLMKNNPNYKTKDICEELGITESIYWKIIHEARLKLINDLEDKELL